MNLGSKIYCDSCIELYYVCCKACNDSNTENQTCTSISTVEVPSNRPTPSNPNLPTPAKSLASERASNYIH